MFEMMPFARRDAMEEYERPFRALENMERSFFNSSDLAEFKTDVQDLGNAYLMETDLPGFDKKNIHVDVQDGQLTVSAERHANTEDKDEKGNIVHSERSWGTYSRSFDLDGIDESAVTAAYEDGVLKLTLPKKAKTVPAVRRLEIE